MSRPPSIRHLLLLLALSFAAGTALADPPQQAAPLGVGTPGPLRQLFLDPTLADARAVGSRTLSLRLETVNSWSTPIALLRDGHTVRVQLDTQADALVLSARLPWGSSPIPVDWKDRVATIFTWRITSFWGGFEDKWIEAWHDLVGAFNFQRSLYPPNEINLALSEVNGRTAFDLHSGRFSIGDLVIGNQVLLASGGVSRVRGASPDDPRWGVAARLDVKVPTGDLTSVGGSGCPDAGIALLGTVELAPWAVLHGMVFGTVVSPLWVPIALQPRTFHYGLDSSLVVMAGSWGFILEDRWLSPLMEDGWAVPDGTSNAAYISSAAAAIFRPHNQISVGLRYRWATLAFSEDFTLGPNPRAIHTWYYDSNAPDVVLALTVTRPF